MNEEYSESAKLC